MGTTRGTTGRPTERQQPARRRPAAGATPSEAAGARTTQVSTRVPVRRPRPSRAVIWRRRVVALIVLLALVAAVVWGAGALVRTLTARGAEADTLSAQHADAAEGGSADSADSADSAGEASAAGSAEPAEGAAGQEEPAGPVDPGTCSPRDLDVRLSATPGQPTHFAVTLTNRADVACLLDAGASSLVLTVHSGQDRVWSSGDCVAGPAAHKLLLDSGDSTETAIRWDGTRSAKGCPGGQGTAQAGSYRVAATLGGASLPATETTFTLG